MLSAALLASAALPARSLAAPPSTAELEAKKQQREQALAELEKARTDITALVQKYVELGRKIDKAQAEVAATESEVAVLEMELLQKEGAFQDRAVQLYRSDRAGMLELLLGSASFQDFWSRAHYLVMINQRDVQLMNDLRLARSEKLWLQNSLGDKVASLTKMQEDADVQREQIESRIDSLQKTADELGKDIAELMQPTGLYAGGTPSGAFDRNTVISDAQMRDFDSMTAADIQAFLNRQPGTLKSYRAVNYNGQMKSAAEMIAEAAAAWRINPKVILVKLQKEQSLLADPSPEQKQYNGAMGMGMRDSGTDASYQGFGKQIWWGTSRLHENSKPWKPGISMKIDKSTIYPTNESTYSLYKYTPHFKGTMSFWMLYWRYFGDPLAP